jgi:tRNA pseudouridine38-40 synthase
MKKILLTIEYDGTGFAGWQLQVNGITIQQKMEEALARVLGHPVRLHSSGRTDAGVHARGLTVHFSTDRDLPMAAFRDGVNRHLPHEISVRRAVEVPADFHARLNARGKWYRYSIFQSSVRSPLASRFAWHIRAPLNLEAMRSGADRFVGYHDFAAFRASGCEARTSMREIFAVDLSRDEDMLRIDVQGKGFLRNMIRIMVGTLVEIGLGKRSAQDVDLLLQQGSRIQAGFTAPSHGLCLMEVWYDAYNSVRREVE